MADLCATVFQNCSVGVVGKDMDFTIYDDDQMQPYVSFTLGWSSMGSKCVNINITIITLWASYTIFEVFILDSFIKLEKLLS